MRRQSERRDQMKKLFLNIDQAENDGEGGGAGGAGSQGTAVAEGAEGSAGQGGNSEGAAGQAGNGEQPPAEEPQEFDLGGQRVKYTKAQLIDELRKAVDYTKKTQGIAADKRAYAAKIMRADAIIKELQERGVTPEKPAKPEPENKAPSEVDEVKREVASLKQERLVEKWQNAYAPIKAKYPDVEEDKLLDALGKALEAGEVEDNAAGLATVAENLNKGIENSRGAWMDKLLADEKDPRVLAFEKKAIEKYLAKKKQFHNSGGDSGAGGGVGHGDPAASKEKLGDVAKRLLADNPEE